MEFEQLSREIDPPASLEDRTVAALRHHGLLRPGGSAGGPHGLREGSREGRALRPTWLRVAAAVVIFAAGGWAGAAWDTPAGPPSPGGARFVLLLHGHVSGDESRVFEEYSAWAGRLRGSGRFVSGERLAADSIEVPGRRAGSDNPIQGYFVVSASDINDAVAVAESSPHVARGGQVVVRPIDMP